MPETRSDREATLALVNPENATAATRVGPETADGWAPLLLCPRHPVIDQTTVSAIGELLTCDSSAWQCHLVVQEEVPSTYASVSPKSFSHKQSCLWLSSNGFSYLYKSLLLTRRHFHYQRWIRFPYLSRICQWEVTFVKLSSSNVGQ